MRKLCRNKKALSTVISTLLMILVVMVGMSVVFAYVSFYAQGYQSGIGSSVLESLTIEDICLNSTNLNGVSVYQNVATVAVYNSGQVAATINNVFVDNTASLDLSNNYALNIYVPVGGHVIVPIQGPYSRWYSGVQYDFKVTTLRGSSFEEKIVAP